VWAICLFALKQLYHNVQNGKSNISIFISTTGRPQNSHCKYSFKN